MDLSGLLLEPGDRCTAFGRVVRTAGRTVFEPPMAQTAVGHQPGQGPAPRPSGFGVEVRGVDESRLLDRREEEGALEGWAHLTCTWLADGLEVLDQRLERPSPPDGPRWTSPPCAEPAGGWPPGADLVVPAGYGPLRASGAAVNATVFRPTPGAAVLVVAAADVRAVTAELAPALGDRLCVVASRHSRGLVDATREGILASFARWRAYASGETSDEQGQLVVTLELVRVLPGLVERARSWPSHLVEVIPWLVPVR